jgi:lipid-binding SYLF domain-containing protein
MNKFTNTALAAMTRCALLAVAAVCLLGPLSLPAAEAAVSSRAEIDAQSREALARLKEQTSAGAELASRAAGVLVFPEVLKGGLVVGGEYGEGQLRVSGVPTRYYRLASVSLGFQKKSVVILFMTPESLDRFRRSKGWKAGVDASVAIATLGAGDQIDTETARKPVIAFVFSNKGLMYNLTLEGSRITPLGK